MIFLILCLAFQLFIITLHLWMIFKSLLRIEAAITRLEYPLFAIKEACE